MRSSLKLASLKLALVIALLAGPAWGAVVEPVPVAGAASPNVFFVYDSTASQNVQMGVAQAANDTLGGYVGEVFRYMAFQKVLTGQFLGTDGVLYGDTAQGLLDNHLDDLRFGFAGIDAVKDTGPPSYGPDADGTLVYLWDGVGIVGSVAGGGALNQGLNDATAGTGNFPLLGLFASGDKAVDNAAIQSELMSTAFAAEQRGQLDVFRDLEHYFSNDFPAAAGAAAECADQYVVYLLAGIPKAEETTDALTWITDLRGLGVKTYVVALVKHGEPDADSLVALADVLARAGGGRCADDDQVYGPSYGTCAYIAHGGECDPSDPACTATCDGSDPTCDLAGTVDLGSKLSTVLATLLDQVTSRTRPAVAEAPLLSAQDGQWRVSAFYQPAAVGGAWRGFLRGERVDSASGEVVEEVDFDGLLEAADPSERVVYTQNDGAELETLSTVLASDFATFVDDKRTTFEGAGMNCIAHAFFDTTTEWYAMLTGEDAGNLGDAECTDAAAADQASIVRAFSAHRLGDVVHSSPVIVGPPDAFLDDPTYLAFLYAKQDRPTMVYVGSNDGMLHAFTLRNDADPTTVGQEAWSFVPRSLIERLPDRITEHQYFLDATVVVRDVQVTRGGLDLGDTVWRTILVANLGRGGKSTFALDVTDPTQPEFLWEFTDSLLSYGYGTPSIGRVLVNVSGTRTEIPVAFLQGGHDASAAADSLEGASFYVVNLETGELLKRFSNDDAGSVDPDLDAPFTGTPTAYEDLPTTVTTRAFVGDRKGRMWRIDTEAADVADWQMERFFPLAGGPYDDAEHQKPIYLAPSIALDGARRPILYYGTGNLDSLDTVETNHFYGVRETIDTLTSPPAITSAVLSGYPVAFASEEKITGEAVVFNEVVLFTTYLASGGSCGLGEGRLYGLDYLTGEPRLDGDTAALGKIVDSGTAGAIASITLGTGVPSAPLIRQKAASISYGDDGQVAMTGGAFEAIVQTGTATSVDSVGEGASVSIDLGEIPRSADILAICECEQ